MFKIASGVRFRNSSSIKEGFQVFDEYLRCNISLERIKPFILLYMETLEEPLVFTIRVPMNLKEEEKLRESIHSPLHDEVYFLENCSKEKIKEIVETYEEIILNDGMSMIAITSQITRDWITVVKYKIVDILGPNKEKAIPLLQRFGLQESRHLITALDGISKYTPGDRELIEADGKSVYNAVEDLKKSGMYLGKVLEVAPKVIIVGDD